jgi:hypothetical protein
MAISIIVGPTINGEVLVQAVPDRYIMSGFHDSHNIIGMANILADDDEDLDLEKLEQSIITGVSFNKKKSTESVRDIAKEYSQDLDDLGRAFGAPAGQPSLPSKMGAPQDMGGAIGGSALDADINQLLAGSWGPGGGGSPGANNGGFTIEEESDEEVAEDEPVAPAGIYSNDKHPSWQEPRQSTFSDPARTAHYRWNPQQTAGRPNTYQTEEEMRRQQINSIFGGIDSTQIDSQLVRQEEEEEELARALEQIDQLRSNLTAEGIDLTKIPEVSTESNRKDIRNVLRMLQIKNDHSRYRGMFEEFLLAGSYGLETMFDGKKEWFGTKVDLVGWSDTVKVKLRRMRYNTSSFVSEVMKGYNISHGWRIILELLPSLFLYSRDRKMSANENLISDKGYQDAILQLHDK